MAKSKKTAVKKVATKKVVEKKAPVAVKEEKQKTRDDIHPNQKVQYTTPH